MFPSRFRPSRLLCSALVVILLAAACGGGDDAAPGASDGSGCDSPESVESGSFERHHEFDGVEQPYWIVIPDTYDPGTPNDVYISLPGYTGDAHAGWKGTLPSLGGVDALVAFPDLTTSERRTEPMIRALIDDIADVYCVDRSRVYTTGGSGSGRFTGQLMTEASDVIAAFAAGIGEFGVGDAEPLGPVPLIAWTGDIDRTWAETSIAEWVDVNGCDAEPTITDLGSGIAHHHYEGCDAAIEYYSFVGMGHSIPLHDCSGIPEYCTQYEEFDFWIEVGSFFDANPLPGT